LTVIPQKVSTCAASFQPLAVSYWIKAMFAGTDAAALRNGTVSPNCSSKGKSVTSQKTRAWEQGVIIKALLTAETDDTAWNLQ